MTESAVKASGRAGRPRDPHLDRTILDAATRQLGAAGYANLSLESVAREAGTTVPSLRRRHPTKLDLILAVIDALRVEPIPTADRDPRLRARAILRDFNRALLRDNAMTVVGSLLAEQHRNPALLERFRTRIVESRRSALHDALADGIRQHSLPAGTDVDVATNMIIGSFYARYLTSRGLPANWADRVLDLAATHAIGIIRARPNAPTWGRRASRRNSRRRNSVPPADAPTFPYAGIITGVSRPKAGK